MPGRFPPACESSPAPALLVWRDAGRLRWALNTAAREWPATAHWAVAEWASVAQAVIAEAEQGQTEAHWLALRVRWRACPLEGDWLAWLMPHEAAPGDEVSALREQVARLQEQLHVAGDIGRLGVWEHDIRQGRARWDEHMARFFGFDPQRGAPAYDKVLALIHPDDRERVRHAYYRSMARAGRHDERFRVPRAGGPPALVHIVWEVKNGVDGTPERLIGVMLDDTESVKAAQRQQAVNTQLGLAVGLMGIALWRADLPTQRIHLNEQGCELMGVRPRPEGLSVEEMRERIHPDDRAATERATALALSQPGVVDTQARYLRSDGGYRTLLTRRIAERDEQGRAIALVGVSLDVTEQVATQERLRRAEQRTMLAAEAVGLAIWERDLVSGDTWWDPQMYRLRGLSPDDPRTPNQLRHTAIHPDDLPHVEQRTEQIIREESDYTFDFRVLWPDGSAHWLATRGSVVRDDDGRALRILGINWDVTEHKRGEDARREKAAAEEASHAKSEFLSRMSHELRTPLNAVLGFAQLMLAEPGPTLADKQRERAERIRNAGRHLLALINDVLDLTSMEVGTVPLATQPVAVAPLVHETLQWLAPAAEQAEVALHAGLVEGAVMADAKRLRQVLSNLLSNAVKYNRRGGRVEVGLLAEAARADGTPLLGLAVRDTGRGLTPAQMQRLFEPFNRLGVEHEGIEGTGIGLTIVRALVEHMGGRIEVQSEAGVGSEFRVWLPQADVQAVRAVPEPAAPAHAPMLDDRPIDVLYIEDNPVNVLLVEELVALRPHVRLHVAVDGRSGIARAKALHPRAVLIDLQLPDIDGFEVLRALRADPVLCEAMCIALSASAMPQDIARARRQGFDDYWTKPIDFGQFLGGLDRLAQRR